MKKIKITKDIFLTFDSKYLSDGAMILDTNIFDVELKNSKLDELLKNKIPFEINNENICYNFKNESIQKIIKPFLKPTEIMPLKNTNLIQMLPKHKNISLNVLYDNEANEFLYIDKYYFKMFCEYHCARLDKNMLGFYNDCLDLVAVCMVVQTQNEYLKAV